ncbi:hypothetical protein PVK06_035222 [Gossypium arboreum]|uniref:Chloride channel protein n=1 Tax=Gossypium arboreum TaxID=29729 RepID=A0ABR0NHF1_GOSAR|nr:hypothetical protein PVK06_035222 [Gossypium arboreum]
MLSNCFQNGMETARLVWSRLPRSEEGDLDGVGLLSTTNNRNCVESLDYEAQRGKLFVGYNVGMKWFFAFLIGIGKLLLLESYIRINISVENFAGWKFSLTFNIIQKSYLAGCLIYILINLALVFSSVYIITQFAPAAAGSGIPEIKGYLNGIDIPGILLLRTLIGKIFGSIGSVGGGLALGKEGPLVHTGTCIASLLGQGGSTKYHISSRWLQGFKSDRDRHNLVTCGCAAGVAAAFRAPVGGVLFALEEVTSWWRSQLMWRVFFTSAIVAVVVCAAMEGCKSGNCGHFGLGGFIIWDISGGQEDYSFEELLPMAVIGVIGGLLGALFNQLTIYVTRWRRNYLHKKGNRVKFYCSKEKEYNDLATIFFNTQDDAIRNLFSAKTIHEFSAQSLLAFVVMFYTLAVITFGTAVPAGQFVPGIMIGSTYGRLVGIFTSLTFLFAYHTISLLTCSTIWCICRYALLGAASFLGVSVQMTVSLCVIMVEITNNLKLLPLIMLVLLISKAVGDAFNEGLYEEQARLCGIPLLESRPKYEMRKMTAKEACGNQKVIDHTRNGETLVIGLMLRSHLLVLLQSKIDFQYSPLPCDPRGGSQRIGHNFSEFAKPVSSKGISINDIHLSSDDLEMYIDLAPFLNPSPYVVLEDMSLTKVYNIFRQLGLRHIFVVPRGSRVIGVITRKDLLIEEETDSTTMELQSTSVRFNGRGQRHEKRLLVGNADAECPLLNGLLIQDHDIQHHTSTT